MPVSPFLQLIHLQEVALWKISLRLKRCQTYGKHQVHKGLDLGIKKGECFTLLGPSGCGKTVLIRLIAGHEVPDEGRIIIDNTVVADSASGEYIPPERRGLGIVFQDYAVWPHMTVYDNIAYPLKMEKRPKEEIDKLVMKMIDIVGMKGLDKTPAFRTFRRSAAACCTGARTGCRPFGYASG